MQLSNDKTNFQTLTTNNFRTDQAQHPTVTLGQTYPLYLTAQPTCPKFFYKSGNQGYFSKKEEREQLTTLAS